MLPEAITSERLTLRPWAFDDVGHVLLYANDDVWGRYLPVPFPYEARDAQKFVATQVLQVLIDWQEHPCWAIRFEARVVGGINLALRNGGRIAEIGYSVARAFWRRGLATEAVGAVMASAFQTCPQLARIRASADARNLASARVMEKVGMKREGLLRSNRFERGELVDVVHYGVLRGEWESQQKHRR